MCILNAPKTNNNMLIVSGSQTSLSGLPHLLRQRQEHFQFKGMVRYVHAHRAVIASQTMPDTAQPIAVIAIVRLGRDRQSIL